MADPKDDKPAPKPALENATIEQKAQAAQALKVYATDAILNEPKDTRINSIRAFNIALPDHRLYPIARGEQMIPASLADHWYLKAHGVAVARV